MGSWLLFDGTTAIFTGSFTTPDTGPYQGQPGPWANIVGMVGIEPSGTFIMLVHIMFFKVRHYYFWLIYRVNFRCSERSLTIRQVLSTGLVWCSPGPCES